MKKGQVLVQKTLECTNSQVCRTQILVHTYILQSYGTTISSTYITPLSSEKLYDSSATCVQGISSNIWTNGVKKL